jgi:uncharacterized protein (DUF302 family)
MRKLLTTVVLAFAATAVAAQDHAVTVFDGDYDDASFAVESAIVGKGLVIDYVSHVGEMLARTGADVGSDVTLFEDAQIFVFCSASLSRQMMEAELMNIAHCPYGVFVADTGDAVLIGHRTYPDGPMKEVEALLAEIVQEAQD